jgi:hypothetical protein
MNEAAWLIIAFVLMLLAMSWFALSLKSHWKQVTDGKPASHVLRGIGWLCVVLSGLACLQADHASMAVLVWAMLSATAAFIVGQVLSYRPTLLKPLALFRA